jgi:glutamate-1-semialdehyde 2,1-aminomutase
MEDRNISRRQSAALFEEAKQYFPGGVHSPVRAFKSVIGPPLFIRRGEGCRITDVDGNRYLDFCCSWGPLILGHGHPRVKKMILEAVESGTTFGTPSEWDLQVGRLLLPRHRFIEKIRFVSSGTEAVMSALRLARGVTGKSKVVKFEGCYHGHVDSLMVKAGSGLVTFGVSTSAGIPEAFVRETLVLPLGDVEALETMLQTQGHDIACVIIEPVPANNGLLLQDKAYLEAVRRLCTQYNVLLIFDEVISGFRVGFEGAAGYYDIRPDIVTYGKIIGGGMPVGAYGASAAIMGNVAPEGPVYQAGTLSANPVAMAAGLATLEELLEPGVYASLERKTEKFTSFVQAHCDAHGYEVSLPHIASIFWIAFSRERIQRADQIDAGKMEFFKTLHFELLQRGVYLGPSGYEVGFISTAHGENELDQAADALCRALDVAMSS